MNHFHVDFNGALTPFTHYWETCVGSCHAATGLRADWRAQLKQCHDELGFQYVRFHGLLNDDMSVLFKWQGETSYSFFNVDSVFDYILSIGMKPFVELNAMPEAIASGSKTLFHYKSNVTPPADYNEWESLIEALTRHLVERYGLDEVRTWYFEVWNEPNLKGLFWDGTMEEYFRLYKHAALAIKRVDQGLRVGGPATAENKWIPETLEFCRKNNVPIDFISTHHYPTDVAIGHGWDMETQMKNTPRGALTVALEKAIQEAEGMPLFYTEWNTNPSCTEQYHDEPYASSYVTKTLCDQINMVELYSFWTFTDIFEEHIFPSQPFHGGFGLMTIHGIPKPTYRAFQLLHRLGTQKLDVSRDSESNIDVFAVKKDNALQLVITNSNALHNHMVPESVTVSIDNLPETVKACTVERIDATHANPKQKWLDMGSPTYLSKDDVARLYTASIVQKEALDLKNNSLHLQMPEYGTAFITITF